MDKEAFTKLAPMYYVLAIALKLANEGGPLTRQVILKDYDVHEDGEDAYCLIDDSAIWDRAIAWLVERKMIVAFTDPFGPPIYNRTNAFGKLWNDLCTSESPFQNARASGDFWTDEADEV